MKLLFKQRFFSWFDSYDIYNEAGDTVYTVKGQLAWGHCLKIFDAAGNEIGTVKERVLTFLPKFELYLGEQYMGCISKEFTFFRPKFNIDCNGWMETGLIGTTPSWTEPEGISPMFPRSFGTGRTPM